MESTFIHILGLVTVEYSIFWHDLDIKHQNYIQRNISTSLHGHYVRLVLHDSVMQSGMTFKEILSHMAKYSHYHHQRCAHITDGKHFLKHVSGPCGQISIGYKHPLPLHYDWTMQTWKGHILNITVHEVNVPFVTHHCNSSFLLLTESTEVRHEGKQIAKLCGQSHNKIFYSAKNTIKVVVEATDVKPHTVHLVHFQYEAVSHKALHAVELKYGMYPLEDIFPAEFYLLRFISHHTEGYVYFYRTIIISRFVVRVTSDCNVKIYDGPSSKSPPLKANIDKQGRGHYTSTLHVIAVYFTNIQESSHTLPRCIYLATIQENITVNRINISRDIPYTLMFNLNTNRVNVYHKLLFQVPQKMHVNIQLKPFKYGGSTEYECYLSGILFVATQAYQMYGPFCGELGMNILVEKGLTFGSHTVFMLIYKFAESVYRQTSFGINVKSEFCVGFINPCNIFISLPSYCVSIDWFVGINMSNNHFNQFQCYNCSNSRYSRTTFLDPITLRKVPKTVGIEVDNTKADTCYHIQYFSTTLQDKECLLEFSGENVMNVTMNTYFDHYQAKRCHNCSGLALRTYPLLYKPDKCKRESYVKSKKYHEVSITNTQSLHIDSANHFLFWSAPVKNFNRTINVEFHVMVNSQRGCSIMDLGNLPKVNMSMLDLIRATDAALTNDCSDTSFNIKRNAFLSFYTLLPLSRIAFKVEFENPALCNDNNHSLVLFVVPYRTDGLDFRGIFLWIMHE